MTPRPVHKDRNWLKAFKGMCNKEDPMLLELER
jgi:hypothetical protein